MVTTTMSTNEITFRWAVGDQVNALLFARLSILSMYRYLPSAIYCLLYNGSNFDEFQFKISKISELSFVKIIDQNKIDSPFSFTPSKNTAWWKWIPLNLGLSKIECIVDIDILFIKNPEKLISWVNEPSNLLAGEDYFNLTKLFNAGNFARQMKLNPMINVGFLGFKDNVFKNLFVKKSNQIRYGETKSSYHIDEQGAANVAVQIGERSGYLNITRVPINIYSWFGKNLDIRNAEFIHFVAETKDSLIRYYSFWNHISKSDVSKFSKEINDLIYDSETNWITPETYRRICFANQIEKCIPTTEGDLY